MSRRVFMLLAVGVSLLAGLLVTAPPASSAESWSIVGRAVDASVDATVGAGAAYSGTVTDASGAPVGAHVRFYAADGTEVPQADVDTDPSTGAFGGLLPPGRYWMCVLPNTEVCTFWPGTAAPSAANLVALPVSDVATDLSLVLPRTGTLDLNVLRNPSDPTEITGAAFAIAAPGDTSPLIAQRAYNDSPRLRLDVAPGTYVVCWWEQMCAPGVPRAQASTVTVTAGQTTVVNIVPPTPRITWLKRAGTVVVKVKRTTLLSRVARVSAGEHLSWESRTPRTCRVTGYLAKQAVRGLRAGRCTLRAIVYPTALHPGPAVQSTRSFRVGR